MGGKGCERSGVCGKKQDLAALMDLLLWVTKGLGAVTTQLRKEKKAVPEEVNRQVRKNLCMTQTNTNFDKTAIEQAVTRTLLLKKDMLSLTERKEELPHASVWEGLPETYEETGMQAGVLAAGDVDIRSFRELITYAVKGMASLANQADRLGMQDTDIDIFMQRALGQTLDDRLSGGNLLALTMEAGRYSVRSMDLIHRARIARFGEPEKTEVFCAGKERPGILVAGSGMQDLYLLLEQTRDSGIDVYTHGELLAAYAYPKLKEYPHFAGNYGGSWQNQKDDFERFHGPVLATSEGVFLPRSSYKDRLYTTDCAGIPGCVHIEEKEDGSKDFAALIEQAKTCAPPEKREDGIRITGYGCKALFSETEEIAASLQNGSLSRIAAVIGDDGRAKKRVYYSDLEKALPDDALILTAGSVSYRLAGTKKMRHCGELADAYAIIQFALRLREVMDVDSLNQLPLFWSLSWHSQKSIMLLLGLLYLDIKRIHLGPSWPAFLKGNVHAVFSEYFGIRETGSVQQDLESVFGASGALITADLIVADIVDQYPSLIPVMAERGLHCIGCGVSRMETLAQACMTHGLDVYELMDVLNAHLQNK